MKTLKTVLNSFTSVKIFYIPLGHFTLNISAKKTLKYNARIDGESMC